MKSWTTWRLLGGYADLSLCRLTVSKPLLTVLRGAAPQCHSPQELFWEADTALSEDSILTANITLPIFHAAAPTDRYLYLEPILSDEGVIKHIKKKKKTF